MGIQKEILTRQETATVKKMTDDGEVSATLTGNVGALALGKPGDVIATAYGPVTKAVMLSTDTDFGTFVEGKGIVTNSDDVAGIGTAAAMFDTKSAEKGQVVSVLVSGGVVVPASELATIKAKMNVIDVVGEVSGVTTGVVAVIVNGLIPAAE